MPPVNLELVEAFSAKAAIVNAVADAAGRRVRDLPANLEQVALGHKVKKK